MPAERVSMRAKASCVKIARTHRMPCLLEVAIGDQM